MKQARKGASEMISEMIGAVRSSWQGIDFDEIDFCEITLLLFMGF